MLTQISEIKGILLTTQRKDAHSIKTKHSKDVVKFKVQHVECGQAKAISSSRFYLAKGQRIEFRRSSFCSNVPKILLEGNGQSSHNEGQRCLSPVRASLSPGSPEEDSVSGSSEGLGPKIDLNLPRRKLQISFTCDACGARTQRLINPDAYARGTIFVQCAGCEVYHKLVDNLGLIEEYDFRQETYSDADGADLDVLD